MDQEIKKRMQKFSGTTNKITTCSDEEIVGIMCSLKYIDLFTYNKYNFY